MMMKIKSEIHSAVLSKNGYYHHFGITSVSACLYGDKVEDIVQVEISLAHDQTKPPAPQNDPNVNEVDYWAWWDAKKKKFGLIFGKYFLLDMCFPYGMDIEEERGQGKAYRVNVNPVK